MMGNRVEAEVRAKGEIKDKDTKARHEKKKEGIGGEKRMRNGSNMWG